MRYHLQPTAEKACKAARKARQVTIREPRTNERFSRSGKRVKKVAVGTSIYFLWKEAEQWICTCRAFIFSNPQKQDKFCKHCFRAAWEEEGLI